MSNTKYSVPSQSRSVFQDGIINNPLISVTAPNATSEYAARVRFEGTDAPSIPINWRFAESVSALKGFEAVMVMALVKEKYGVDIKEVTINTDHAQLFFMSTFIWTLDPDNANISAVESALRGGKEALEYFPSNEFHRIATTFHRAACTNIYRTKDARYFHLHGSMNPGPSLESIGLPQDIDAKSLEEGLEPFIKKLGEIDSEEMQRIASDVYKQAGTICWTTDEYKASEHYKANADAGLFKIRSHENSSQEPCWWQSIPSTSAQRPLSGLKVVDITRVIAAPAITRGLAELGASVMRVTASHLADYSSLHCDMNWGKWNSSLDFRKEEDRKRLQELILDADVVVTAYRPYVLDKWGFGEDDILKLCSGRKNGIIYVRENCYGWNGPWAYRSVLRRFYGDGRAMGNEEAVTPVFPNSDFCTGIAGVCGVLQALILRGQKGGSYSIDTALNYYSQWLVNSCGTYSQDIWQNLWESYDKPVFRHYHNMIYTLPRMISMLQSKKKDVLFRDEFFEDRDAKNRGIKIRTVKPILSFKNGEVSPGYNVGTRPNGVDQPYWPKDLLTEVVV